MSFPGGDFAGFEASKAVCSKQVLEECAELADALGAGLAFNPREEDGAAGGHVSGHIRGNMSANAIPVPW
jgi:hypothetical protein